MAPKKRKANHLQVVGTSLRANPAAGLKGDLIRLLSDVPVHLDFDNESGDRLLTFVQQKVAEGVPIETVANEIGLGDEFVAVYKEWSESGGTTED